MLVTIRNYVIILCNVVKTMDAETSSSSSENDSGISVYNQAELHLVIDFENVEDILDFSVSSTAEAENTKRLHPSKQRRKMTATEPVKLLELKPQIDKFANDEDQSSEEDHKKEITSRRRFQCIYCGSKFVRSTHLHRHIRIHTGDKPYACHICRRRFSRSDYKAAHVLSHRREKVHYCCVCGQAYHDLTTFADHCRTHNDSEYIRIAMGKELEVVKAEDPILISTFKEEIEEIFCITIVKVDNSTTEESIKRIENPHFDQQLHII